MELSIVIPALNEAGNIGELITNIHRVVPQFLKEYEIILIDGGSTDDTRNIASKLKTKVITQKEQGYGGALKDGFKAAKGDYIVTLDADLSHSPDFIPLMWKAKSEGEIVVASRYISGGSAEMPLTRKILSRILNKVFTRGLSLPLKDISSGFRLYHSSTIRELDLDSCDFDILEEVLIKCYAQGWKIKEIPFHYYPRKSGVTHARLMKFAISYLRTFKRLWTLRNSILSADYDDRAFNSMIPVQRYWQRRRYEIITELAIDAGSTLDIGCGSSRILKGLNQVIGLDIQMSKLRYARKYEKPLVNASIFNLPFRNDSFDCVICSEVIEHIPPGNQPFTEINRVLRPGGQLIIGTPDYSKWQWRFIEQIYNLILSGGYAEEHITQYSKESLVELLETMGYTLKESHYILNSEMILRLHKPT